MPPASRAVTAMGPWFTPTCSAILAGFRANDCAMSRMCAGSPNRTSAIPSVGVQHDALGGGQPLDRGPHRASSRSLRLGLLDDGTRRRNARSSGTRRWRRWGRRCACGGRRGISRIVAAGDRCPPRFHRGAISSSPIGARPGSNALTGARRRIPDRRPQTSLYVLGHRERAPRRPGPRGERPCAHVASPRACAASISDCRKMPASSTANSCSPRARRGTSPSARRRTRSCGASAAVAPPCPRARCRGDGRGRSPWPAGAAAGPPDRRTPCRNPRRARGRNRTPRNTRATAIAQLARGDGDAVGLRVRPAGRAEGVGEDRLQRLARDGVGPEVPHAAPGAQQPREQGGVGSGHVGAGRARERAPGRHLSALKRRRCGCAASSPRRSRLLSSYSW